jgi:hypothetical protein
MDDPLFSDIVLQNRNQKKNSHYFLCNNFRLKIRISVSFKERQIFVQSKSLNVQRQSPSTESVYVFVFFYKRMQLLGYVFLGSDGGFEVDESTNVEIDQIPFVELNQNSNDGNDQIPVIEVDENSNVEQIKIIVLDECTGTTEEM